MSPMITSRYDKWMVTNDKYDKSVLVVLISAKCSLVFFTYVFYIIEVKKHVF